MASSLLNKLKLIAGESIDTTDPTDPDNPNNSNQAIIDRYKNVPGVNVEKLTEYVNLNIPEPQTIVDAMLLAEAVGYTSEQAKVVGAQWALESTRGTDTAGADYNYFGVKSHNDAVMKRMSEQYGIDVTQGAVVNTEEVYDGKTEVIQSTFASFKNPIEGFLGKKAFLETNKRYKEALNPENTADQFAAKLKAAGYATDPDYVKKIRTIYNGPMRTVRPTWMQPTKKNNVPQTEWTMTGVQPTEGSRAGLVEQKESTSKNPIIAEYENFILAPEETKEWWYNIYKDDLESGKITEAELDKQIAIDKKEKNREFQEYLKDPLAFIQNELTFALENREEGDSPYVAALEKVFTEAQSSVPEEAPVAEAITEETLAPEKIDLQSAEEAQAAINVNALQEWNNLQKQNWAGVKEWDPKGVEMLKEYNKKMGVNYVNPSEAWSGVTISNAVMAGSGANNINEIRAKGFNPSKGHSYYISDAFKTSKDPNYKYNKYKAEKLSGKYNIGDILVKGRKPKEGIDTSKWSYEDFKSHGPGYASHTDIIVDKGTDDKGEYIEIAGGNVGDTYATERIYVADIPSKNYKATLRDKAGIKPYFSITPLPEEEDVATTSTGGYNPFVGEKKSSDAILDDIKYNPKMPKMPRMVGYTDESVSNYLKDVENYENVVLNQLAEKEENSVYNYEKLAAENAANESAAAEKVFPINQMLPEVLQVAAKKSDDTKDEIIPLQKPVEQEINMEYLNNIPDVNSFISPGSFTNESRSKEQLKQNAEAEQFIMSPLKRNANSGYFGSGQSLFYPSTRQQKYGGAMAPIIPTYYKSKGTPIYRDTTDAPPRIFENGGGKMKFNKIYPSKYKNYPRYYNDGGLLDGVDPENPINYQVDAATGNLRIYDPNTNSFNVTNVPYKGDNTVMMSHMGERFLGTDNKSREAVYSQLKMAQDFYNMENQRSQVAQKQLAERTDMLIDKKGKAFLPSTTYDFLTSNGGKSGCMAGSSGCFEPTEEQLQDPSYKSELTIPYFLKSKDDRYVKQILPFRNTSPEGFAQTYRNTEFRPNIFPTARVKNPNFGKVNSSTGNVDNREYITRTTSKGNTRSEGSTQTPGGVLPTITGSATYIAQYPKLGLDEIAVGEPIEPGDRVTLGGRKGVYYDDDLQRYVTSDEIKRTGKSNDHHNYGIGTEKENSGYLDFDEEGNPIKEFNVGAIGGNLLYQPNFKKQPYGPNSTGNYSGSGNLVTRYKGDTPYYNSIRQDLFKDYGFDEASASDYIKNYERSQVVPLNKLPVIKPGLLEQKSSGNIIRGKEYPNTRKGRKQKESSDAYIKWYMSQMQKK